MIPATRHLCALAVALGAGAAMLAAATTPAPAAGPAAPAEIVSPLPGTPDANPATQISFLGAPASRLRDVVVRGSVSGPHAGRLVYYSTHTGGSFLPQSPFDPGEHVTVTATLTGYGAPRRVGTSFTVSTPYTLPQPAASAPVPVTSTNVTRFHSRHDLEPPAVTVTTPAADPSLGDIFISPVSGPGQAGPMIVAPDGRLVWFQPLAQPTTAFNLQVQRYRGAPVLTWWQGEIIGGHGQGEDVIADSSYRDIATVHAGNGLYADLHDFVITPQNTAWLTAYAPVHWDLSAYRGRTDGLIDDCVVEQIDIHTGLVMFAWQALGHIPIADSYKRAPLSAGNVYDYVHVNSIDPLPGGDLLISSRNTWAVYRLGAAGSVAWELGGKHSSFKLGPGVRFAWQHDATLNTDGSISIFDNEAGPSEADESRGEDVALNLAAHTASLVRSYTHPGPGILSESQGNVQHLTGGDVFVGWGQAGSASEFSPSGALTFDMRLPAPTSSYRAYRMPWKAVPDSQPALVANPVGSRTELWASWNGATGVTAWRLLAGSTAKGLSEVAAYPSTGFETTISAPTAARYLQVQALDAHGHVLRNSPVIDARAR